MAELASSSSTNAGRLEPHGSRSRRVARLRPNSSYISNRWTLLFQRAHHSIGAQSADHLSANIARRVIKPQFFKETLATPNPSLERTRYWLVNSYVKGDAVTDQVSTLERIFPTRAIRWGLLAILGTPAAANSLGELIPAELLSKMLTQMQTAKIAVWLALVCLIAFFLVLAYALILNESHKHSRIIHLTNQHPHMSAKWLIGNATWKHYLFLLVLSLSMFFFGFYAAHP